MKIARYRSADGQVLWGTPEETDVRLLEGPSIAELTPTDRTFSPADLEPLAPVDPPNIVAVGLNYREHIAEFGHDMPERPVLFLKATTSVTGPGQPIELPEIAPDAVDLEAELAVVIGRRCKHVKESQVREVVLGYTIANDVTARDCQKVLDAQWARAKSFDTFCPLGPWIETELDPSDLAISSAIDGVTMQRSRTSDMIFSVERLVAFVSRCFTLEPGTLVLTGTPPGVGYARDPKVLLREGNVVTVSIEGIGELENPVVGEEVEKL